MSDNIKDIDPIELDALIVRVKEAKKHKLALGPEDCQLLLDALLTLAAMHERLADNDVTINKLKKLVGMIQSSETLGEQLKAGKPKKQSRRQKPKAPAVKPKVVQHKIEHICKGDVCPECGKGKVYKYEPATLLRITGQSPFVPEQHVMERLRCNACGAYITAELSPEIKKDGDANQKYGYSARTMMVLGKFFAGSPYYRQSSLQSLMGVSLSASTIWDQAELVSNDIFPVMRYLSKVLAADAVHFEADDTTNKIIGQQPIKKPGRNGTKAKTRTGLYTSGIIATTAKEQKIVLFNTDIGHAGEYLDDILKHRNPSLSPPIIMTDALSSNKPTVINNTINALCNAHGRRNYYDVHCHFPEEVEHIIERYGEIWANEKTAVKQRMSPSNRLAYHKKHSLPVMEAIRTWGAKQLADEKVEENSGLGKAIKYFDRHYDGLTMFCQVESAKLDNNSMEGQLKLVALNRKNANFFKSSVGAAVGDVLTSIIATCSINGVNAFEYLNTLQRNADDVKAHPAKYLPWNFKDNG